MNTRLACLLLVLLLGWTCAVQATIVDPAWLKNQLGHDNLLVIDVREPEEFLAGHIHGSANLPPMSLFAEHFLLPPLSELQGLLGAVGIDHQRPVLVVGNQDFIWAARLYWILEFLGHQQVYFLDTAWGHWEPGLLPISQEPQPPTARQFIPRIDERRLATKLSVLAAIGYQPILDGRTEAHYLGLESGGARRAGHIPTAQHFPWTQNREEVEGIYRLRDLSSMASVYEGLPKDQNIILYCTGSAQAAVNYVVLQALGYQVAVYEGSWSEWGNDLSLPKVNPSRQPPH
ncbi:rhodanese-like domain-containing protein [Marinospirillum sp. MEB164]|uniref:Sulfurtransferase n=1 Tax=Marinospirillum alkalitolerans TaxID=3123374 RepID=A0ABW8PWS1_9GAMM